MRDHRNGKNFVASQTEKMNIDDLKCKSMLQGSSTKGSIIEIVEEAMKWRLDANNKKQFEVLDEFAI